MVPASQHGGYQKCPQQDRFAEAELSIPCGPPNAVDNRHLRSPPSLPTARRMPGPCHLAAPDEARHGLPADGPHRGRIVSSRRRRRCIKIQPTRCPPGCSWGSLRSQRRQELVITAHRPALLRLLVGVADLAGMAVSRAVALRGPGGLAPEPPAGCVWPGFRSRCRPAGVSPRCGSKEARAPAL